MTKSLHPAVLASLIIIRNKPIFTAGSAISTIALLTVERLGQLEARFDLLHRAFDQHTSRADILDGLAGVIPPAAALLVRTQSKVGRSAMASGDIQGATDLDLLRRQLPKTTVVPFALSDRQLTKSARELGLAIADARSTQLAHRRRAPEQAMAFWARYTAATCHPQEAQNLIAAFRAWHALEEAKPIRF